MMRPTWPISRQLRSEMQPGTKAGIPVDPVRARDSRRLPYRHRVALVGWVSRWKMWRRASLHWLLALQAAHQPLAATAVMALHAVLQSLMERRALRPRRPATRVSGYQPLDVCESGGWRKGDRSPNSQSLMTAFECPRSAAALTNALSKAAGAGDVMTATQSLSSLMMSAGSTLDCLRAVSCRTTVTIHVIARCSFSHPRS